MKIYQGKDKKEEKNRYEQNHWESIKGIKLYINVIIWEGVPESTRSHKRQERLNGLNGQNQTSRGRDILTSSGSKYTESNNSYNATH